MFIRNVPISHIKDAASLAIEGWRSVRSAFSAGRIPEAIARGSNVVKEMRSAGRIIAGAALAHQVIAAMRTYKGHELKELTAAMNAVERELARLSNGKVRPTLHLYRQSSELSKANLTTAISNYNFFLPVEPLAIQIEATSTGSILPFAQAIVRYHEMLNTVFVSLVETRDMKKLNDVANIAATLQRRVPPSQASIICGAISAWASAQAAISQVPGATVNADSLISVVQAFEMWVRQSASLEKFSPNPGLLSYSLCSLVACRGYKRAAHMVTQYGLQEIFIKTPPDDVSVSLREFKKSWSRTGLLWGKFKGSGDITYIELLGGDIASSAALFKEDPFINTLLMELSASLVARVKSSGGIRFDLVPLLDSASSVIEVALADRTEGERAAAKLSDSMKGSLLLPVLNVADSQARDRLRILEEILADIKKAGSRSDFGDHDAASKICHNAAAAAGLISKQIPQLDVFVEAVKAISQYRIKEWPGLSNAYGTLVRCVELYMAEPDAAKALVDEVTKAIANHQARQKAVWMNAQAPTDIRGDAELFSFFMSEAEEVCANIDEILTAASTAGRFDNAQSAGVRRAFHTLKGSSRMVGLSNVGECAWIVEQLINRLMSSGPLPLEVVPIAKKSSGVILEAVRSINHKGAALVNVNEIRLLAA